MIVHGGRNCGATVEVKLVRVCEGWGRDEVVLNRSKSRWFAVDWEL